MSRPRPALTHAIALYTLFAIVATAANIAAQELTLRAAPTGGLALSILAGTIVGFAVKYVLDKVYVFADDLSPPREEARKVMLYGAFSVLTTLIFWSFEILAWWIWQTPAAKYAGAIVGLSIGYAAKFVLDSRFVFRREAAP